MDRKAVELAKLRHNLSKFGVEFTFTRPQENSYQEPDLTKTPSQIVLTGIFHMTAGLGGYASVITLESGKIFSKPMPMILCAWEDFDMAKVQFDDRLVYNGNNYKVVRTTNLNEMDIAADISLELVV